MLTPQELSKEAKRYDTKELAGRARVSTKTIYRLRAGSMPSLATYTRLLEAMRQMNALGLKRPDTEQGAA